MIGWSLSIDLMVSDTSFTTSAVRAARSVPSVGAALSKGRLSFRGSVLVMRSHRPGPSTTSPHRCSVAYFTLTTFSGKLGSAVPSKNAHSKGPSFSKLRSHLLLLTTPVSSSKVAKLHLKAISPGFMVRPAPRLSKHPLPR